MFARGVAHRLHDDFPRQRNPDAPRGAVPFVRATPPDDPFFFVVDSVVAAPVRLGPDGRMIDPSLSTGVDRS